jgi:hypothetical protein
LPPGDYGEQTPRTALLALKGAARAAFDRHDADAWLAWHIAALMRWRRDRELPELKTLMAKRGATEPKQAQPPAQMKIAMDAWVRASGGQVPEDQG